MRALCGISKPKADGVGCNSTSIASFLSAPLT